VSGARAFPQGSPPYNPSWAEGLRCRNADSVVRASLIRIGVHSAAYQRLRKPPPPAPPRSVFGRASLMFSALPSTVVPFKAAMAFSPSPSLSISTNPKPLGCPESRSVQMLTRPTVPWGSNSERTVCSVCRSKAQVAYKNILHSFRFLYWFEQRLISKVDEWQPGGQIACPEAGRR
jgi:hypothetical protein